MHVTSAGNTTVPAYLVLLKKGYTVSKNELSQTEELWIATKNATELSAEDPLTLLGLVEMIERRGPNWKASDAEIDAFMQDFNING